MPRYLLVICLLALVVPATAAMAAPKLELPTGPIRGNPADRLLGKVIDDYAYDHARRCKRKASPGALALESWLAANAGGSSWGILRCEKLSGRDYSLHAEGRAVDWHLDARVPRDRRRAIKLIRTLTAPDKAGNTHALARRMGIQEIIWNCRSWWSGSERLERYPPCKPGKKISPTLAHKDHVHIGLTRAGAARQTSFWRR